MMDAKGTDAKGARMPDDKLYLPEHFDGTSVTQVAADLLARRGGRWPLSRPEPRHGLAARGVVGPVRAAAQRSAYWR